MRNRPMFTRGGAVIQAGLDARPKGSIPVMRMTAMGKHRAIVLNTYVTDDESNARNVGIECDVILTRSLVPLRRVPVKQLNHGHNNAWAPWIPRPSTRVISTNDAVNLTVLSDRGTYQGEPSLLADLDGDLVIVEFLDHDPDSPLITGALSHEQNRRRIVGTSGTDALGWTEGDYKQGSPRRDELYFSHAGSEIRVNGQGDVLVSTVGATDDPVDEDASGNVGQVRIRVKNSMRFTVEMDGTDVLEVWKDGSQVKIDLGEGAAQRLILGDDFRSFLNAQINKINLFWTAVFNSHVHTGGALPGGLTGPPNPASQQTDSLSMMSEDVLSDLARTKKS